MSASLSALGLLATLMLLLSTPPAARAQRFTLTARVGVDENGLAEVESWQQDELSAIQNLGIQAIATDSFPPFVGIEGEGLIRLGSRWRAGAHVGFGSSSGRLDYSDYSGALRVDRSLRRTYIGASGEYRLVERKPWAAWTSLRVRVSRTVLEYERTLQLEGAPPEIQVFDYSAWPMSLEPAATAELLLSRIVLRAQAGWEWSFGGALAAPDPAPPAPRADWGGYRVGLAVGLAL